MSISAFYILCVLYALANIYAALIAASSGGMILDGYFFYLEGTSLLAAFVAQAAAAGLLIVFYCLSSSVAKGRGVYFGGFSAWALASIQVAYVIFSLVNGVNIAGNAKSIGPSALNYVFIFLQPDALFAIVGVFLRSNRHFALNAAIFILSMVLRGWMGGIFVVFIVSLCRYYPFRINLKWMLRLVVVVFFLCLIMPFVIQAKWDVRRSGSLDGVVGSVLEAGYWSRLEEAARYIANRLQHVGHVALLAQEAEHLNDAYLDGDFLPYWLDGLPQQTLLKLVGYDTYRLNNYIVHQLYGLTEAGWNTNPGIAGWFFVLKERSVFLLLYLLCVVLLPFYWAAILGGGRALVLLASFSIFTLYHGWIGVYFNFTVYLIILLFLSRVRVDLRGRKISGHG